MFINLTLAARIGETTPEYHKRPQRDILISLSSIAHIQDNYRYVTSNVPSIKEGTCITFAAMGNEEEMIIVVTQTLEEILARLPAGFAL